MLTHLHFDKVQTDFSYLRFLSSFFVTRDSGAQQTNAGRFRPVDGALLAAVLLRQLTHQNSGTFKRYRDRGTRMVLTVFAKAFAYSLSPQEP